MVLGPRHSINKGPPYRVNNNRVSLQLDCDSHVMTWSKGIIKSKVWSIFFDRLMEEVIDSGQYFILDVPP